MYIASIKIENYKSYLHSSELELRPGINIITGQNNAGKTALLKALGLGEGDKPHRSVATVPQPGVATPGSSIFRVTLSISREELDTFVLQPGMETWLACPKAGTIIPGEYNLRIDNFIQPAAEELARRLLRQDDIRVRVQVQSGAVVGHEPSVGDYEAEQAMMRFRVESSKKLTFLQTHKGDIGRGGELGQFVVNHYRSRCYVFNAERFNLGICRFGSSRVLNPDASNLAEVLSSLQGNPMRFGRFKDVVHRVLPQIKQVTIRNLPNNMLEILIWPHDPASEREDIAIPLNESGTGVGQVLAILYVVLNAEHPQTILIDEPQSFLHPGAARKLVEVLRENSRHQYILTTHSPTVITAANPATITLIKCREGVSDFQAIDPKANDELRHYMVDIGARLSDAFGADDILWVEGPTEELCLPLILEKVAKIPLLGTAIIAVKHTGDLEGKHAKTVAEIYKQLSKGRGLLPPAVGFIFDREERSNESLERMRRECGSVAFLQRRLYENYLLNPRALAALVNGIEGFSTTTITAQSIENWVQREVDGWLEGSPESKRRKYGPPPADGTLWRQAIHGANLLKYLFSDMSETRVSYDKVQYSVRLTQWLVENCPEDLQEVAFLLKNVLAEGRARNAK
jgi:predicted ATPase